MWKTKLTFRTVKCIDRMHASKKNQRVSFMYWVDGWYPQASHQRYGDAAQWLSVGREDDNLSLASDFILFIILYFYFLLRITQVRIDRFSITDSESWRKFYVDFNKKKTLMAKLLINSRTMTAFLRKGNVYF